MLLGTAYFLIGEQPSWQGLVGVFVVTLGGFLLAFSTASAAPTAGAKKEHPSGKDVDIDSFEIGSTQLLPSPPDDLCKIGLVGSMVRSPGVQPKLKRRLFRSSE